MTDERFIKEIIKEVEENFKETEEQGSQEFESIKIEYFKGEYKRLVQLLAQINKECDKFTLEAIGNNTIRVHKKSHKQT